MNKLDEILEMWKKDAEIDRTEPGKALLDIPKLHSKYLNLLSRHKLLQKEAEMKYSKMKRIKWEYYTGKMDRDDLAKYGWQPFQYTLKSDLNIYFESDEDLNKIEAQKILNEQAVDACQMILKELNSRTFQLRDFIAWERFIQGV